MFLSVRPCSKVVCLLQLYNKTPFYLNARMYSEKKADFQKKGSRKKGWALLGQAVAGHLEHSARRTLHQRRLLQLGRSVGDHDICQICQL